jgi:hypothetical protein
MRAKTIHSAQRAQGETSPRFAPDEILNSRFSLSERLLGGFKIS